MDPASRAHRALDQMRSARQAGDLPALVEAGREALDAAVQTEDAELLERCAWRLSKALADTDPAADLLAPLAVPLERQQLFTTAAAPLERTSRLLRRHFDGAGYASPLLPAFLRQWRAAHERAAQPFLAGLAALEAAWYHACRGDRDQLVDLLDEVMVLTPQTFGSGPYQHPQAPDGPSSVFWVQRDLCVHVLLGACFAGDVDLARQAQVSLDEVFEEGGSEVSDEITWVAARARAADRFGHPDAPAWAERWLDRLPSLPSARRAHDRAVAEAIYQRGPSGWAEAAALARSGAFGPEWEVDASLAAGLPLGDVEPLIDRFGLTAFHRRSAS